MLSVALEICLKGVFRLLEHALWESQKLSDTVGTGRSLHHYPLTYEWKMLYRSTTAQGPKAA